MHHRICSKKLDSPSQKNKQKNVFLHNIVILPLDLWLKMQNTPYQSHADLQKLFIVSGGHVRSGAFMQTSGA